MKYENDVMEFMNKAFLALKIKGDSDVTLVERHYGVFDVLSEGRLLGWIKGDYRWFTPNRMTFGQGCMGTLPTSLYVYFSLQRALLVNMREQIPSDIFTGTYYGLSADEEYVKRESHVTDNLPCYNE